MELDELRRLCGQLPVPDGTWHPGAAAIAAVRRDFEWALDRCARLPAALALVGDVDIDSSGADPELVAAWERLRALPLPEGRHPFLDEIAPALEAATATLAALSRVGGAAGDAQRDDGADRERDGGGAERIREPALRR